MYQRSILVRSVGSAIVAMLVAAALNAPAMPASAAGGPGGHVSTSRSVPAASVRAKASSPAQSGTARWSPERATWPTPGQASVDLPASASAAAAGPRMRAGSGPVWIGRGPVDGKARAAGVGQPSRVRVHMFDRVAAAKARVSGLVFRVSRDDGVSSPGRVAIDVDVSGFVSAFGGDWQSRLRMVRLPSCALDAPATGDCATPVQLESSVVDVRTHHVSATVDVTQAGELLAVTASPSSDTGDFSKTPFSSSYQWQGGGSGGDFSWSYDLDVPKTPGGLEPEVSLSYSSGAVDGQTAGANVQPGVFGEGWGYSPGFIERAYRTCAADQDHSPAYPNATGDQCWRLPNARLVWGGKSTELIIGDDGKWRAADDDAARVELLTGTTNGDNDGEYWRVTTVDGTQFYFGRNRLPNWTTGARETKSAFTVPVFANHTGEPCFKTGGFSGSWCDQAWRWNLDYVVDRNGNSMAYFYTKDQAKTGRAGSATSVSVYDRGGWLEHIEYGMRAGSELATTPPAKVLFATHERCFSSCWSGVAWGSAPNTANWPDTPWDLDCPVSATSCPNNVAPSFFVTRIISQIRTKIWTGSGGDYSDVSVWDLTQSFPSTGNGTSPVLWLASIRQIGEANGGFIAQPPITFGGTRFANRADYDPNANMADPRKYRITSIDTETGGRIEVGYTGTDPQCQFGSPFPDPDQNGERCFPQYYKPQQAPAGWSWWHKYVVNKVTERDMVGGSPDVVHSYTYSTAGSSTNVLWAHDDGPATWTANLAYRSWADWRGYSTVTVTDGPAGGPQTQTSYLYFRGLKGDHTDAGEDTRASTVTNSLGEAWSDDRPRAGFLHETARYAAPGGQVLEREIADPVSYRTGVRTLSSTWAQPSTQYADITRTGRERTRTYLPQTATWRSTSKVSEWDAAYGVITSVNDYGDTSTSADNICTRTEYAPNTTTYLVDFPTRRETVGVKCELTPTYPADAVEDTGFSYDTKGNVTKTTKVKSYSNGWATAITESTASYDGYGRTVSSADALGRTTTTKYTDGANGLTSTQEVTNPAGHVTTTNYDPALGVPTKQVDPNGKATDAMYDALGRLTKVWLPGRDRALAPNTEYAYRIQAGAPAAVETRELGPNGNQISSFEIYDGLLRLRQTQATAPDGKRTIDDTGYDARGLAAKTSTFYNSASGPTSALVSFADTDIASQHRFGYDGLERQTSDALWSNNALKWQTTTRYDGDRTTVFPPTGETVTQEVVDADGNVIERRLYASGDLAGPYDATKYDYDDAGRLVKVTDPAGNHWDYGYDLLGRQTSDADPDAGTTTTTYDNAGQLLTKTDSRGKTLAYAYDDLGRQTGLYDTSTSGTKLASWTYDTVAKGRLTSSTRFDAGNAYTSAVTGYDDGYRPLGESVTIPAAETGLAGTYMTSHTYKVDGSPATMSYPAVANLAAETVTYNYSDAGQFVGSAGLDSYLTGASYDFDELPLQRVLGAGGKRVQLTTSYDPATRLLTKSEVYSERPDTPGTWDERLTESYGFDAAANLTSLNETSAGVTVANQCFQYDNLRRLKEAWTTASSTCQSPQLGVGGVEPYWQSYEYDKVGNRTKAIGHATGGDTTNTYVYPAAGGPQPHALGRIDIAAPGGSTSAAYGYDVAGNTTSRPGGSTLTWDLEGHLSKSVVGGATTTYVYDADGDRLIRRDATGTTVFLDDTELRVDPNGALSATRYYGDTAVRGSTTGLTWLSTDYHGTGQIAISAASLNPTRRRLDPFGENRAGEVQWPGDKGFVGGTKDSTGLTHLGAREYDAETGRFIAVDPQFDDEDPQSMQGYAYSDNNPTSFSDPDGTSVCLDNECRYHVPSTKKKYHKLAKHVQKKYEKDHAKKAKHHRKHHGKGKSRKHHGKTHKPPVFKVCTTWRCKLRAKDPTRGDALANDIIGYIEYQKLGCVGPLPDIYEGIAWGSGGSSLVTGALGKAVGRVIPVVGLIAGGAAFGCKIAAKYFK